MNEVRCRKCLIREEEGEDVMVVAEIIIIVMKTVLSLKMVIIKITE